MGIGKPPQDLDVLITDYENNGAAAPMFDDLTKNPLIYFTSQQFIGGVINVSVTEALGWFIPHVVIDVFSFWLSQYIVAFAPDIYYGYGGDNKSSDDIKETFFHEYGHAAHYHALDDDLYWLDNILHFIDNTLENDNPPYGSPSSPESGRTAIIESWGYHIGVVMADLHYGLNHSFAFSGASNSTIERRQWVFHKLETYNPTTGGDNGNTTPSADDLADAWIPVGVYWDCIDDNADNPAGIVDPVTDPISGFTHTNIFNAVSSGSPTTVQEVRNTLITTLPPGVNPIQVGNLFSAYGFN